jgi:hypothetical protein
LLLLLRNLSNLFDRPKTGLLEAAFLMCLAPAPAKPYNSEVEVFRFSKKIHSNPMFLISLEYIIYAQLRG